MSDQSERKTDRASKRKLEKQREKGVVSQAAEMANYLAQMLAILFLVFGGRQILVIMERGIDASFFYMNQPVEAVLSDAAKESLNIYLFASVPVAVLAMSAAVLVKLIYQKGFVFAIDPIIPKFERINPTSGLKRIFGMRGWVELTVSIIGLSIWALVAYLTYTLHFEKVLAAMVCGLSCFVDVAIWIVLLMVIASVLLFLVFSIAEGFIQRFLFNNDQKMTKTEVKQERKDQFGSAEVRSARKKFRKELETEAESSGVDNATMAMFFGDMVVAIRYHPSLAPTPMLSAKSSNAKDSLRIRRQIRENGYMETKHRNFVEGMMLARVGKPVPPEMHDDLRDALYRMFVSTQ